MPARLLPAKLLTHGRQLPLTTRTAHAFSQQTGSRTAAAARGAAYLTLAAVCLCLGPALALWTSQRRSTTTPNSTGHHEITLAGGHSAGVAQG